ncbi:MAG: hypothetical protein KatS3mg082_2996 [Nitrospiraceae bacterium]|nr:MAG: hypothetical protein KatS3mg082_2996 [Nitrospiraceae bacterium]
MPYRGAGREFEFEFLNPSTWWFTENENELETCADAEGDADNISCTAGLWWRAQGVHARRPAHGGGRGVRVAVRLVRGRRMAALVPP